MVNDLMIIGGSGSLSKHRIRRAPQVPLIDGPTIDVGFSSFDQEVPRGQEKLKTHYDFGKEEKTKKKFGTYFHYKGTVGQPVPKKPRGWKASRGPQEYFGRW